MGRDAAFRRLPKAVAQVTTAAMILLACLGGRPALATTSNAGSDQTVLPATIVTLDGSASTSSSGALAYRWTQFDGPSVALETPQAPVTQFISPDPTTEWVVLQFRLEVTDGSGTAAVDELIVVVSDSLAARNVVRIHSPPNEFMGQGVSFEFEFQPGSADLRVFEGSRLNGTIDDLPVGGTAPLRIYVAEADGRPLTIGRRNFAYRSGDNAGKPSLSIYRGRFCSNLVGSYVVHDIAFDDSGAIERLALDFREFCLDVSGSILPFEGNLRYNSVIPPRSRYPAASAGDDLVAFPGQRVRVGTEASWSGTTAIDSIEWEQLSGPPVAGLNLEAPLLDFFAPDAPVGGTDFRFRLTVRNGGGFADSDTVTVHVLGPDEPTSFAYFEVEDGGNDWVFGSGAWLFDTNNGRLTMQTYDDTGVVVGFNLFIFELDNWNFQVTFPAGELLAAGDYPHVEPTPDNRFLSLNVGGNGRGYNRQFGSAIVHEVRYAEDGKIESLAMDVIYKGDGGPRIYGVVRYNTTVPLVSSVPVASAGVDQPAIPGDFVRLEADLSYIGSSAVTSVSWRQVSGPPVQLHSPDGIATGFVAPSGGGVFEFELTVTTADGSIATSRVVVTVGAPGTRRSLMVVDGDPGELLTGGWRIFSPFEADRLDLAGQGENFIQAYVAGRTGFPLAMNTGYLQLVAIRGETLETRAYEDARYYRDTYDMLDRPAMLFALDGFACLRTRGRFEILQIERSDDTITSFAANLEQTCDPTGAFLRAQIRVNSPVPVRDLKPLATAGRDLVVRGGQAFALDGLGSGSWHDPSPSYRWRQTSGAPVDISPARLRLGAAQAVPISSGSADAELELEVVDELGNRSADRMNVRILGPEVRVNQLDVLRSWAGAKDEIFRLEYDDNDAFVSEGSNSAHAFGVSFVSERIFNLEFQLNDLGRIPETSLKIVDGKSVNNQVFEEILVRLVQIDEFNEFALCDDADGVVRVAEANLPGTPPVGLAADFDLVCPAGDRYQGSIRYDSNVPIHRRRVFAHAGPDRLAGEFGTVILDATASMAVQDDIVAYRWRQLSGPPVSLRAVRTGVVSFEVPSLDDDAFMRFEVEATSSLGRRDVDVVEIHAEDSDSPPPPPPAPSGGGGGGTVDPALAALFLLLAAFKRILSRRPCFGIMPAACRTDSCAIPRSSAC